ncbi:MAG: hypothetical protein LBE22_03760 [Azoarcus sp.]|jgi:hypothetical protein|nr:hypothetical protein [Azoarcus sp.]
MNTATGAEMSQPGIKDEISKWFKGLSPVQLAGVVTGAVFVVLLLFVVIVKLASPPKFAPQQRPSWEQAAPATDVGAELNKTREAALLKEREAQQQVLEQLRHEIGTLRQDLADTRNALTGVHERLLILEARRERIDIIRPGTRQQGYVTPPQQAPDGQRQPRVLAAVGGRTWLADGETDGAQQSDNPPQPASKGAIVTSEP